MIKHAFLIECHNYPQQLLRLINRLDSDDSLFFVHIDKKHLNEMEASSEVKSMRSRQNVTLVNPINVYWGDFSQVEATLIMLKEAYQNKEIGRFHLLSGIDYPLKSRQEIQKFFEDNDSNYIQWIPKESQDRYFIDRYYFYSSNYMGRGYKHGIVSLLLISIQRLSWLAVQVLHLNIRRKIPLNYYHGSNWFSLTRSAVSYIFSYIDNHEWILKRFRHTAVADESFFTMILKDGIYKGKIINDDLRLKNPDGTLNRGGYVLTENDYTRILKSSSLFGRKFIPETSDKLMNMLDANFNHNYQ